MFGLNENYNEVKEVFDDEYLFKEKMFKDEYEVGDKVYYLDNKNHYKLGRIKEIERDDTNKTDLYLITGCQYLRTKEHIYGLYV